MGRNILAEKGRCSEHDLLERLNAYIAPVDAKWQSRLKPADASMLDDLAFYLGMKEHDLELPASFIEFAKFAGEDDGGLLSVPLRGRFSIRKMLETAIEIYEYEPENMDPCHFEFILDEVGMAYILCQENESGIYYEDTCWISSSFENLLFQCAIRLFEEKYFKERLHFGSSKNSFRESERNRQGNDLETIMREIVSSDNLQCAWFNDACFFFAYNEEYSVCLKKENAVAGKIMGKDTQKMTSVLQRLLPQIGGKIVYF